MRVGVSVGDNVAAEATVQHLGNVIDVIHEHSRMVSLSILIYHKFFQTFSSLSYVEDYLKKYSFQWKKLQTFKKFKYSLEPVTFKVVKKKDKEEVSMIISYRLESFWSKICCLLRQFWSIIPSYISSWRWFLW